MQHMTEGGFGRLQIVRVLDRDVKLVHRKAGPAALRVGKTGLLGEDLRNEIRAVFSFTLFMLHLLFFFQDVRLFSFLSVMMAVVVAGLRDIICLFGKSSVFGAYVRSPARNAA